MKVSFVVIGLNEGKALVSCLKSIYTTISTSHLLTDSEVIYVDSGSCDNSIDLVSGFASVDIYLLTGDKSAAAARKVGELNSTLDYIVFLDGDMELHEGFLNYVFDNNYLHGVVVGCIGLRKEYRVTNNANEMLTDNYYKQQGASQVKHIGGALLVRRNALLESGGWEPKQKTWEESLLLCRINGAGGEVIGIEKPFIAHFNTKKPSITNSIRSYCRPYGTGYDYIKFFINSLKDGDGSAFVNNQACFCLFLFISLIILPCLIMFRLGEYYFLMLLFLMLKFTLKNIIHSFLRTIWLLIFILVKHQKFVFKWEKVTSSN